MSYFITGTDTGVGKTLIGCALLRAFSAQGKRAVGFKPVAAGCDADGHNEDGQHEDARQLRASSNVPAAYGQVNPYCFAPAIAPHIAAQQSGVQINFARIMASYRELAAQADVVIVEGAGGFCVPLNDTQDSADLVHELNLPVILVVGMRLGCLNHALLSTGEIAARGLSLAGWVANVMTDNMPALQENITALEKRIAAPLLGVIPYMPSPDAMAAVGRMNLELLTVSERHG